MNHPRSSPTRPRTGEASLVLGPTAVGRLLRPRARPAIMFARPERAPETWRDEQARLVTHPGFGEAGLRTRPSGDRPVRPARRRQRDGFRSGRLGNQRLMRSVLRRHPSGMELAAWFDGEHDGDVGAHVARCRRCQRDADALGGLRTLLRPAALRATEHVGRGAARG